MDTTTLLLAGAVILVVYLLTRRPSNYPPYPSRPLPLVGHLFLMDADSRPQFKKWRKQLGDIFSLNMAGSLLVVLNGYDVIKEALVKKADDFSDRSQLLLDQWTGIPHKGLIFANGQNSKEQRTVTMSILRNFGMGKNFLAEMILAELASLTDFLAKLEGRPINMRIRTSMSIANVLLSLTLGERFEYDDATFNGLMENLRVIVGSQTPSEIFNFFPVLTKLPGDLFGAKRIAKNTRVVMETIVNKFVREKSRDVPGGDSANNFVAAYLKEREKKVKSGQATTLDEENLAKIIFDVLSAGIETTSTTLLWLMLYAVKYPDVQKKIQTEIDDEIGAERSPTMHDKTKLVHLNAFILEVQRLVDVSPHSIPHMTSRDTTLGGFNIPKHSVIIPNLDSILHDKKIWGDDVMSFRPERFITDDGKLKIPEQFIPFSIGRRACLGEGLASMILFLFMSSLFQRFQLLPKDLKTPPDVKYIFGLDVSPLPFELKFIDRRNL